MADNTTIEWTDATWNPITGCSVVSPGCTNCYAMKLAGTRLRNHPTRQGLTRETKAGPVWNGEVRFNDKQLLEPLSWKRPRMIFVCAHGDLFHQSVPDSWIDRVFAVMALCPHHTFQVLTKRPDRMRDYVGELRDGRRVYELACDLVLEHGINVILIPHPMFEQVAPPGLRVRLGIWPLPNVWLGTSVEDQRRADERIPHLLETPAAIRFLSAEPLLGPVNLTKVCLVPQVPGSHRAGVHVNTLAGRFFESGTPYYERWNDDGTGAEGAGPARLDWVIVGGESGPDARPMHPDWARALRDQCQAAGVPFFFKQWGNWADFTDAEPKPVCTEDRIFTATGEVVGVGVDYGRHGSLDPDWREKGAAWMGRVRKSYAGRLLDGVEHNAMPASREPSREAAATSEKRR